MNSLLKDTRDLRDPQALGKALLLWRVDFGDMSLSECYDIPGFEPYFIPHYDGSGFMSADPAEHHSKTPQNIDLQEPGDGT